MIMKVLIKLKSVAIGVLFVAILGFVNPDVPNQNVTSASVDTVRCEKTEPQLIKHKSDIDSKLHNCGDFENEPIVDSVCSKTIECNENATTMKSYLLIVSPACSLIEDECLHIFEIL
jgi:hypothetical protein